MGRVTLKIQPGAVRSRIAADGAGGWRLSVPAPPVDGKANRACAAALAELCGVAKSAVELVRGASARLKTFEVRGVADDEIARRLAAAAKETE